MVRTSASARNRADAEYVAHACNAYPKLVAAMREIIAADNANDMVELTAAPCERAVVLLKELGETLNA